MRGDCQSMAEADGATPQPLAFTPGVDFDPDDVDAVGVIRDVMDRHGAEETERLRRDNVRLRRLLWELTGDEDP